MDVPLRANQSPPLDDIPSDMEPGHRATNDGTNPDSAKPKAKSKVDLKVTMVYGSIIHCNDHHHLNGGVANNQG